MGIKDWTSDTWTAIAAIVAFIALIQPWLLSLWRRLFNRGTLEIYETGSIEIGFGSLGPTIGLMGTLRAIDKDLFVQAIKLTLVKESDGTSHDFEWRAFRDPKLSFARKVGESAEVSYQVPAGFMVSSLQTNRYNIAFSDQAAIQPALPIFQSLQQEWLSRIQSLGLQTGNITSQPALLSKLQRSFSDLSLSPTYQSVVNTLNRLNYWQPGKYRLTMTVQTARPTKTFQEVWSFTITENDLQTIQNNVALTIQEALLPSGAEFGFIFVMYNS